MSARRVIDRSHPPEPGSPKSFRFPEFVHETLPNGLEIYAASARSVPLVNLEVVMPAGCMYEDLDQPGLASLHGELLDEGTRHLSAIEIASAVERLGGALDTGAGWNVAYAEMEVLTRDIEAGLDLVGEVVRSPVFPEEEVERRRRSCLADLLRRRDLPASLAERAFFEMIFGGTVYGRLQAGTVEGVERLTREDFLDFYRRQVVPNGSRVVAVGDFSIEEILGRVERVFGDWAPGRDVAMPRLEVEPLPATRVHLVDRPGKQTQLLVGHLGVPRNHPDFQALILLNAIFGGKFTSRINLNLREKNGFTYGVQSSFTFRLGPGPFQIRTAVGTDVAGAAVRELISEMRRIREEPVSETELLESQRYLVGVFPYTMQTINDLLKRLKSVAIFGLGDDFYESYPGLLMDIDRQTLLEMAQNHFQPDHLAVVAVGPAEELLPQLEGVGPVSVTPWEKSS